LRNFSGAEYGEAPFVLHPFLILFFWAVCQDLYSGVRKNEVLTRYRSAVRVGCLAPTRAYTQPPTPHVSAVGDKNCNPFALLKQVRGTLFSAYTPQGCAIVTQSHLTKRSNAVSVLFQCIIGMRAQNGNQSPFCLLFWGAKVAEIYVTFCAPTARPSSAGT
jgi:hypothetical protein